MNKIKITTNVCLICIRCGCETAKAVSAIENLLAENGIELLFISAVNVFGNNESFYIAIHETDIFRLMNTFGKIRTSSPIRNYSINCSNAMIKWYGRIPSDIFANLSSDIKLILHLHDGGLCFCDITCKDKVCALLT